MDRAAADDLAVRTALRKTTVSWTAAVDHRLDQLVERAAGTAPERSDLLAALVAAAPADGEKLDRMVSQWRKRRVRQVVLDVPAEAREVSLPQHGPGRRRRGPGSPA